MLSPRLWQQAALRAWEDAGRRGIVEVATGAGKTIFAQLCMARLLSERAVPIVIVVPTEALLDQWYVSLVEDGKFAESDIALWSGRQKPRAAGKVNVAVVNTARWAAPAIANSAGPTFLIVDECHRVWSAENVKSLGGSHIATLGLSATPDREYESGNLGEPPKTLGTTVYRYSLDDATRDGILVPVHLINVKVPLLEDEERRYRRLSQAIGRAFRNDAGDHAKLARLLQQRARVSANASLRIPTAVGLVDSVKGRRSIVFHENIDAAVKISANLRARGHRVTLYHSQVAPGMRRDNLRLYRRGLFDVLVCCRALDEGVNIPETEVAVISAATASQRQRIQRLGRVLRPATGKSESTVFTIYATEAEEKRLANEASTLMERKSMTWRKAAIRGAASH